MYGRSITLASGIALAACAPVTDAQSPIEAAPASFAQWQEQCADAGDGRESWSVSAPPFLIHGDTYNVGTCGITALLVASPEGHVLLDSGMPEAAPMIAANIERLGFELTDVKWLLSSHEHLDHVGATAELKALTGAQVAALEVARQPLETGEPYPDDPQAAIIPAFEGFAVDRTLTDGQVLEQGSLAFTVHSTPAHTPGSTSWSWQSCEAGGCTTIVYADSLTTPAADDYRFTDHPEYVARLRAGFDAVAGIPCGILLTPHPAASDMIARFAGDAPLADSDACVAYARTAQEAFDRRLATENAQ